MPDLHRLPNLRTLDVVGRRVFLRADLDGPRSAQGAMRDDAPLRVLLPTLRYLIGQRSKVVVATALASTGRDASRMATRGIADMLKQLLGAPVRALDWAFERDVRGLAEGDVAVAPDLSAFPEEGAHDARWAMGIASSFDVYVVDGLWGARDGGASVVELPRYIVSRGVGMAIEPALDIYHDALGAPAPERYTVILGGPSLTRVAPLLRAVMAFCNDIVLGGAVGNTFLAARGWRGGGSALDVDAIGLARDLLDEAAGRGIAVHFPHDAVVETHRPGEEPVTGERTLDRALLPYEAAVDIGPQTAMAYVDVIRQSATVLWVGMMGDGKTSLTERGTLLVAQAGALAPRPLAVGKDTVAAAQSFRLDERYKIAAGGDVVLSLLADAPFPGLESLGG